MNIYFTSGESTKFRIKLGEKQKGRVLAEKKEPFYYCAFYKHKEDTRYPYSIVEQPCYNVSRQVKAKWEIQVVRPPRGWAD